MGNTQASTPKRRRWCQLRRVRMASLPATRPASPLARRPPQGQVAVSAPGSRRGSFSKRPLPALTTPKLAASDAILPRAFVATIGTEPTGRGKLKPSLCPVHSYASDASSRELPRAFAATIGTEPTGRGAPQPSLCAVRSYASETSNLELPLKRRAPAATFGSAPRLSPSVRRKEALPAIPPQMAGGEANDFKEPHSFHATFGSSSKVQRPRGFHATFGTSSRFGEPQVATSSRRSLRSVEESSPNLSTLRQSFGNLDANSPRALRAVRRERKLSATSRDDGLPY